MRRTCVSRLFQQQISGSTKRRVGLVPSQHLLVPSVFGSARHHRLGFRSYATVVGHSSGHNNVSAHGSGSSYRALKLRQRPTGPFSNPEEWLVSLEPYLPAPLRTPTASPFLKIGYRFAFAVPNLLRRARDESNIDLLGYLGVDKGRWKAVHWLVTNLIEPVTARTEDLNAKLPSHIHWESGKSLDDATQSPVWADHGLKLEGSKFARSTSLAELTGRAIMSSGTSDRMRDLALRQVWQSIGYMILQAAGFAGDKSREIMSNVYQIIAYLHHVGAVPDTIYNYPYPIDSSVPQRPPTLYLLSARILTTLSDAVWRAQEEAISAEVTTVGAQFPYKGYGSPSVRHTPRVRELGHGVWLEFALWSCVESGYVAEGAWVLNEMGRRSGDDRWSTVHWSTLQRRQSDRTAKEFREGWFRSLFFKNGVIGTNEGYSDEYPLVEMGPRTISTEAVTAVIDGLLSTVHVGLGGTGNTPGQIQDQIYSLKAILGRDNFGLPSRVWNSVIIRLLESQKMDPEVDPASLERVLALAPTTLRNSNIGGLQADSETSHSVAENVLNQSNALLGLLHRTLHAFALQGNIRGARRVYARIQSYIINWKMDARPPAIANLRRPMHDGDEAIYFDADVSDISEYLPDVPEHVLTDFIDLITDAKAYDFGRWLLYSNETGGSVVRFFSSVTVAPALLRFAAATSDSDLLNKVTSALVVPLPETIIRSMFQCHIALSDWDGVEKLLVYFKEEEDLGWSATEAATLARAIVLLESAASVEADALNKAKSILRKLLHGDYNTTQLSYERRDISQVNLLAQLVRIFRTIPGALSELCQNLPENVTQPSKSVDIPVDAFNILLDAVVSTKGSLEGRRMWHMWCKNPEILNRHPKSGERNPFRGLVRPTDTAASSDGDRPKQMEMSGVVQPNLTTLRTILQPAVAERRALNEKAARYFSNGADEALPKQVLKYRAYRPIEMLDWGSDVLRRFGLRGASIDAELGGHLYRRKRPFARETQRVAEHGRKVSKKIRSLTRYSRFLDRKNQSLSGNGSEPHRSEPER